MYPKFAKTAGDKTKPKSAAFKKTDQIFCFLKLSFLLNLQKFIYNQFSFSFHLFCFYR
jgi:hypothetical protein